MSRLISASLSWSSMDCCWTSACNNNVQPNNRSICQVSCLISTQYPSPYPQCLYFSTSFLLKLVLSYLQPSHLLLAIQVLSSHLYVQTFFNVQFLTLSSCSSLRCRLVSVALSRRAVACCWSCPSFCCSWVSFCCSWVFFTSTSLCRPL